MDAHHSHYVNLSEFKSITTVKLILGKNNRGETRELTIPIEDFINLVHNYESITGRLIMNNKCAVVSQCRYFRNGNCMHGDECNHVHCDKIENIDKYQMSNHQQHRQSRFNVKRVSTYNVGSRYNKPVHKSDKNNFVSTRDLSKPVRDEFVLFRNMIITKLLDTSNNMSDNDKCDFIKRISKYASSIELSDEYITVNDD